MNKLLITIVLAMCFVAYASTAPTCSPYSDSDCEYDTSVYTSNRPPIRAPPIDMEYRWVHESSHSKSHSHYSHHRKCNLLT